MKESITKIREIVDKKIISHLSVSIDESEKKFKKISEEFGELKKTKFTKTEEKLKIQKSDSMEEIKKLEEFFSDFSSMKNSPKFITTEELVKFYPDTCPKEYHKNPKEYFLSILKDYKSKNFQFNFIDGSSFKVLPNDRRIILILEKHSHLLNRKDFIEFEEFIGQIYELKGFNISQILSAYKKHGSKILSVKFYPTPIRIKLKSLEESLASQIDYYFSEENLKTDKFLREKMGDKNYVPISLILGFKAVSNLMEKIKDKEQSFIRAVTEYSENAVIIDEKFIGIPNVELLILNQLNYYFSNENWISDTFLKELSSQNDEGFMDLTLILGFKKMMNLMNSFKLNEKQMIQKISNLKSENFKVSQDGRHFWRN
jgi:hypothetical protein